MKIIITNHFKNKYLGKRYSILDELYLVSILKSKEHTFIKLKFGFVKIKVKVNGVAHRGIARIIGDQVYILALFVSKKNKQLGENISRKKDADLIKSEYAKSINDLSKGLYKKYD